MSDEIRRSRNSAVPTPQGFHLIERNYRRVFLFSKRWEVERFFGPPSERHAWDPELAEAEQRLENEGRNVMPKRGEREWDRWYDPADQHRWVAVLYGGDSDLAKVFGIIKKGF